MKDIKDIRDKIDITDEKIVELFEDRLDLAGEVGRIKKSSGSPVFVPERELEKIKKIKEAVRDTEDERAVTSLYTYIMLLSRMKQYKMRLGDKEDTGLKEREDLFAKGQTIVYQGVRGAYGHEAAMRFFGRDVNCYSVDTFREAMDEVKHKGADFAVLPIENSSTGIIDDVYDILAEYDNHIVGECTLKIGHALLGLKDAEIEDIRKVYSHPQGLLQTRRFLSGFDWEEISARNTAVSAKTVMEKGDRTLAAVASPAAADLYDLKILKDNISDNPNNSTRFIVVSAKKEYPVNGDIISICFELKHEAGSLYKILTYLYYNDLSMTKIESRPIQGTKFEYRFYVDFEGNLKGENERAALKAIEMETENFRLLGNYKGGST